MIGIRFERLFRASVYLMLVMASVALSIDSSRDNPTAMAYPLVTLILSVWAFQQVDRGRISGLSRRLGSTLALLSIPLVFAEVRIGWRYLESDLLVLALGHWLLLCDHSCSPNPFEPHFMSLSFRCVQFYRVRALHC